jgi:hypothetical protein
MSFMGNMYEGVTGLQIVATQTGADGIQQSLMSNPRMLEQDMNNLSMMAHGGFNEDIASSREGAIAGLAGIEIGKNGLKAAVILGGLSLIMPIAPLVGVIAAGLGACMMAGGYLQYGDSRETHGQAAKAKQEAESLYAAHNGSPPPFEAIELMQRNGIATSSLIMKR